MSSLSRRVLVAVCLLMVASALLSLRRRPAQSQPPIAIAAFAPEIVSAPRTPFEQKWSRGRLKNALFSPDWKFLVPEGSTTLLSATNGSAIRQFANFSPPGQLNLSGQIVASVWSSDSKNFASCGYFLERGAPTLGKYPEKYRFWVALWDVNTGKAVWRLEEKVRVTPKFQPQADMQVLNEREVALRIHTGFNSQIWRVKDGKIAVRRAMPSKNVLQTSPNGRFLWAHQQRGLQLRPVTPTNSSAVVLLHGEIRGWSKNDELIALQGFRGGVYRTRDGQLAWPLKGEKYSPNPFLGFSSDGKWALTREFATSQIPGTESVQQIHQLREARTGKVLRSFAWESDIHATVPGFSPDNRTFALPYRGGLRFYSLPDGQLQRELEGFDYGVGSAAFSPDGATLATGDYGTGKVILWNWRSRKIAGRLDISSDGLSALAWSRDGKFLATGNDGSCGDDTVRIWRVSDRKIIGETRSGYGTNGVSALQWSPDGALLGVASAYASAQILDKAGKRVVLLDGSATKGREESFVIGAPDPALVWSSDGRFLMVGGKEGVSIWNRDGTLSRRLSAVRDVCSLARCPSGQRLVLGTTQGEIVMLRAADEHILWRKNLGTQNASIGVAFLPSDRVVSWGDGALGQNPLRIWNATEGVVTQTLHPPLGVRSATVSHDGRLLASIGDGVTLWETAKSSP